MEACHELAGEGPISHDSSVVSTDRFFQIAAQEENQRCRCGEHGHHKTGYLRPIQRPK